MDAVGTGPIDTGAVDTGTVDRRAPDPTEAAAGHHRISVRAYSVIAASFIGAAFFSRSDLVAIAGLAIGSLVTFHVLLQGGRWRWWGHLVVANAAFWSLYGLLIGSFPGPFESVEFFATEGRILLYGIPLIALTSVQIGPAHLRALDRILAVTAAGLGILLLAYFGGVDIVRSPGTRNFHALTSSHHAPAFIAGVCLTRLALTKGSFGWVTRALLVAACVGTIIETSSRAALVGLAFAGLAYALWHRADLGRALTATGLVLLLFAISIAVIPRASYTVSQLMSADFQAQIATVTSGGERSNTTVASANILRRFSNWTRASDMIRTSPLIGIGAWRYDDDAGERSGIEGVARPTITADRRHSDAHTHNVYLQVLAETGLIGFAGFALLWIGLLRDLERRRSRLDPLGRRWQLAGWCGIAYGIGVSLTDIGLINLALALPLLLVVGSALVYQPDPAPDGG